MKRQRQTVFGDKVGNCFSTCVASLLDLDTETVPNFCLDADNWFEHADKWLEVRGYRLIDLQGASWICVREGAFFIASGPSPRGSFLHSVICTVDNDLFVVAMDPHPSDDGLAGPFTSITLVVKA